MLKPSTLVGVKVEILMLQRPGYGVENFYPYCSENELMAFWRDYLVDNGVKNPEFTRIRMGGGAQ